MFALRSISRNSLGQLLIHYHYLHNEGSFQCYFFNLVFFLVSTLGFFIGPHIRHEYWCSSQEAESREISKSCKNLFLNRCKINMFKKKKIWSSLSKNCIGMNLHYEGHIMPHFDTLKIYNWEKHCEKRRNCL